MMMCIRIEAFGLPGNSCGAGPDSPGGYHNIHVGVQHRNRRDELLGLVRGDATSATWTVDCDAVTSPNGLDLKGRYIQGPPGGQFILWFDAIPPLVIENAMKLGLPVGRLGLTDPKRNPLCAAVRPPLIEWSASAAGFDA
jgi:hypothetical protein